MLNNFAGSFSDKNSLTNPTTNLTRHEQVIVAARRVLARSFWFLLLLSTLSVTAAYSQENSKSEPIAIIAGQPLYENELLPLIKPQLRQLQAQEYLIKSNALDDLISLRLLEAEAKRRGVTSEELLRQQVESKTMEPTDAEVEAFYLGQKDRRPFDEIKAQVRETLKETRIQQTRLAYLKELREKAAVSILLRAEKVDVGYDPARLIGNDKAQITIVEFSDFECPFCRKAQATLKQVLLKYDGRVKLAFRDFPLKEIHPQAPSAAEASRCAGEQGKFWEYHDLLFVNQSELTANSLIELARGIKLDEKRFGACLSSGKFRASVEEDLQEGENAGVSGTPTFFINGVLLSGAQSLSEFEKIIESELQAQPAPQTQSTQQSQTGPGTTQNKSGDTTGSRERPDDFMFLQSAERGRLERTGDDKWKLTLFGVAPDTYYFANKPQRIAGTSDTSRFLRGFGFEETDPPNAAIVFKTPARESSLIAEVTRPSYNPKTKSLSYVLRPLSKDKAPEQFAYWNTEKSSPLPNRFGKTDVILGSCSDTKFTCQDANLNTCGTIKVGRCWKWKSFTCRLCQANHASDCNNAFPSCCNGACETNCDWANCKNVVTGCNAAICQQCLAQFDCKFQYNNNEICSGDMCVIEEVYQCNDGASHSCFYTTQRPDPPPPKARTLVRRNPKTR